MNWLLLRNSLLVSSVATILAMAVGLLAALWMSGLNVRGQKGLLCVALATLALPPFLVTNTWIQLLGQTGVWRAWLPLDIFSLGGAAWILGLLTWPVTMLLLAGAWSRIEASLFENDPLVTGWRLVRFLLLPAGRTALLQAAVLTFVLSLNNFAVPAILQVKVFPAEMWVRFNTTFDTMGALKLSWPLVFAPLLLLYWFSRREIPWPRPSGGVWPRQFRRQLGPVWFGLAGICTVLASLVSAGLPFLQIISTRRTWTELPGALAAGKTALSQTIFFASFAATLIVGLALALRGFREQSHRTHEACEKSGILAGTRRNLSLLFWLPFLVPGVLLGIALIFLFNRAWSSFFYQSVGIVILAFVIRYLAWGWTGISHAFGAMDPDLTDAARLDGAGRWQMFRLVHWPQIASQTAAAWYVVFLLCLWDVESMILIVPPGVETLALRVFNLLHYGHNSQVDALCLTLMGVALAPLLAWSLFRWCASAGTARKPRGGSRATGVVSLCFGCSLLWLSSGCSPSTSPENQLRSQLFSRVEIIGARGVGVGQLNKPRSVVVDAQDNLYVVDMTGRVQKFSAAGAFVLEWQMPQTDLGKPKGMCRDRDGNILVLEPHYQRVNYFSPEGKLVAQWGAKGTNAGLFNLPRAVAVNSQGEVIVSEYGATERVQRFAPRGRELLNGFGQMGDRPGEFNRPEGLCVDDQDRIYVADSCNHRIQIFSCEGKLIRVHGHAGSGPGELSYPYDICVDRAGRQYVCEFGNSRIQVFDAQDRPLEIIGGPGGQPGRFSNPWGIALDSSGNLYIADSQNHRVQKLIRAPSVTDHASLKPLTR